MNRAKRSLLIPVLALVLAALACNFIFGSTEIEDAWMAFDQDGALRTDSYKQDDIFYAIVLLDNAPDDTEVKTIFYAEQVEGEKAHTRIDDAALMAGSGQVYFTLSNPALWPPGEYMVELYLNGEYDRSLFFQVQGAATATPEVQPTTTKPPAVSQPRLNNAYMARDEAGDEATNIFGPEDTFYCKLEVVDTQPDSLIRADWYAVDVEDVEPETLIDSAEIAGGNDAYTFDLVGNQPWPDGDYKIEISIDNVVQETLEFQVMADRGPKAVFTYAYLSLDEDGFEPTTTYGVYDVFYCIAEVQDSTPDNTIEALWYVVEVPGYDKNELLYTSEIDGGSDSYTFQLFSDQEWVMGTYAVDLYIDGDIQITLEFQVK